MRWRLRSLLRELGPGIITGASDDDPSGIATYSQIGAQFGAGPLWFALATLPGMIAVQEMCARIAIVTRKGLIANIRTFFPAWFVWVIVLLLAFANVINIGADLGMMAASAQLLFPLPFWSWLSLFTLLTLALQIFVPYERYAKYLKWLTLFLFSYVLVAFASNIQWREAFWSTLHPTFEWTREYLFIAIAFIGTTISPYLYVWQANCELETETVRSHVSMLKALPMATRIRDSRIDVISGMTLSNVIAWFVILTAANVLHANGITYINTADEAARVLAPLAGPFASTIFALGIIGTGLLAVPVLSSVVAYACAEVSSQKGSLGGTWMEEKFFYGIIVVTTLLGVVVNIAGVNPIQLLIYSAVANAVIAPPLLFAIFRIAESKERLKQWTNPWWVQVAGFVTLVVMTVASVVGIWLTVTG
ncbi:divalent metal cation transporter [Patescibacteria group bacterium]|nr:divalent metal cation transporter [Patescibacteria group bacterium]